MKQFYILIALLILPMVAQAKGSHLKEVAHMATQIEKLYHAGTMNQHKYNLSDLGQLQQCVNANLKNRVLGKKLQAQVKKMNIDEFKMDLSIAADEAFSCVYCSNSAIRDCKDIPKHLTYIRQNLRKAGYKGK